MIEQVNFLTFTAVRTLRSLARTAFAILILAAVALAQGSGESMTPPTLTPGSPTGSYTLSDFDTVNLFNGNINFRLPLMKIGGRGGAQVPLLLDIQTRWRVVPFVQCSPCDPIYYPTYNWWVQYPPNGYRPGLMSARLTWGEQEGPQGVSYPMASLTRLTFTTADGTEYELRDVTSNGAPQPVFPFSPPAYFNRGSVFLSSDGSSATFFSCTVNGTPIPIRDNDLDTFSRNIEGYLLLRDGMRYRIDGGLVSWMQDRNGNKINFYYEHTDEFNNPDGRVTRIVDSLNRQVTITYDVNDPAPYGLCDRITYDGFDGAPRIIRVTKGLLATALRSDFTGTQTLQSLFPDLSGSSATQFNPQVITIVWLPNDKSYSFKYNDYGELARVVLPTGGAIEYDWRAGMTGIGVGGTIGNTDIYRRIKERRVYRDGGTGSAYESKTLYSRPETPGNPPTNVGYVQVEQYGSGPNHLTLSRHYFYGSASYNPNLISQIDYYPWKNGKEYKTEAYDTDGTTVIQRSENTFFQTPPA